MNVDKINRWLTLGANVGVVIGLIVLIVELRQNSSLTRAAMEIELTAVQSDLELRMSAPDISAVWMKSVYHPEELTLVEIKMMEGPLVAVTQQIDHLMNMQEAGLVSRSRVESHVRNIAPFYFGSRFAQNWWQANEVGWQGTGLYEIAGPIIDGVDENFMRDYFDSLTITPETPPTEDTGE
ncbi:hypothetical protein [Parvularcula marina]|uniref:hypothetical protein n=1 Tax=Parvularcula marina TaxID=2292771 RepID=UPI003517B7B0